MYSKYSGIEVPQNYSGSRFRKGYELKTETKTHTASEYSATKSSVSPVYQEQVELYSEDNSYLEENEPILEENCDRVDEIEKKEECSEKSELSFIHELLKSISIDDLLLICLIIFLCADENINNNDVIILLSLLLAYHT